MLKLLTFVFVNSFFCSNCIPLLYPLCFFSRLPSPLPHTLTTHSPTQRSLSYTLLTLIIKILRLRSQQPRWTVSLTKEQKLTRRVKALRDWCDAEYEKQLKKGQLEVTNLWSKADGDGEEIEQAKGQRGGASHWKLMSLPREEDLFDTAGEVKWQPKHVRLTDDAAIVSLCIHDKTYRATYLPWDFDSKGEIGKVRVPIGPIILITQNGLRSLPVWNDWYIFTGGSNSAGWLLDKRSNNLSVLGNYRDASEGNGRQEKGLASVHL